MPSCSLDFLTMSDVPQFKKELALAVSWIVGANPDWSNFNGCIFEVEVAFLDAHNRRLRPKEIVERFLDSITTDQTKDDAFWKYWNSYAVEYYDGTPVKEIDAPEEMRQAAERIFSGITAAVAYGGRQLNLLYAMSAILEDAGSTHGLPQLKESCALLVEACRKTVYCGASLEIA
jgi:hypothetical protein